MIKPDPRHDAAGVFLVRRAIDPLISSTPIHCLFIHGINFAYSVMLLVFFRNKDMAEVIKGIYNKRRPERTDYYRIIES